MRSIPLFMHRKGKCFMSILQAIRTELFTLQDAAYRDFQSRLLPTIAKERIIGVRIPAL